MNVKIASKHLDLKLRSTQKYFEKIEQKILRIHKYLNNGQRNKITDNDLKLILDYAVLTLDNHWESLRNRSFSLIYECCWKYWIGDSLVANDPFGYEIHFSEFGHEEGMWNIDHIFPFSKGGITAIENGIPISYQANKFKSNKLKGKINNKDYYVKKIKTKQGPIGRLFVASKEILPTINRDFK